MTQVERRTVPAELASLYSARDELERARTLDEVKQILDVALAAKRYAEAKRLGKEMTEYAQEIINRAIRRTGEILAETPREHGVNQNIGTDKEPKSTPRQHAGKKLSAESQKLAAIPESVFEANVRKPKARLLREARKVAPKPETAPEVVTPELTLRHCSCTELADHLEPDSVDLVFTDPPYGREHLACWPELSALAAKVLRPGGLVVAYSGQMFLPEAMCGLAENLDYWWTYAVVHDGAFFQLRNRRTQVGWKPLLVYRKPGADLTLLPWVKDVVGEGRREKGSHDWQQAEAEAAYWIGALTEAGGHIVDPFLGGGTTAAVSKKLGRRFTGCDVDTAAVQTSQERVNR